MSSHHRDSEFVSLLNDLYHALTSLDKGMPIKYNVCIREFVSLTRIMGYRSSLSTVPPSVFNY